MLWTKKTRQSSGLVFRHSVLLVHRLLLMLYRKLFPSKPFQAWIPGQEETSQVYSHLFTAAESACLSWPSPTRIFQWKAKTTWVCWWYTQHNLVAEYQLHFPSLNCMQNICICCGLIKKQRKGIIELWGMVHIWRSSCFQVQETRKSCRKGLELELSHFYQLYKEVKRRTRRGHVLQT